MKGKNIIKYATLIVVFFYFLFLGLAGAKTFLIPITTASIFALVILPVAQKMEPAIGRTAAALLNTFMLFIVCIGILVLVFFQINSFINKWPEVKENMQPKIEQVKNYLIENTPIQAEAFKDGPESTFLQRLKGARGQISSLFGSMLSIMALTLLTFIYIFFLLNYRNRFKRFLIRLFPEDKKEEVKEVISKASKTVQQYLLGKLIMTGILAVFYGIGLGISGVDNFIIISIIAAFLNLIPYIGNIIGFAMAMSFGYLTSGSTATLVGIIITFSLAQFIETYILEPYVVGDKVKLHPFFVIVVVIIGNLVWGIVGMVLAIPILAIVNIILLHVPSLRPFGFLFSAEDVPKQKQ